MILFVSVKLSKSEKSHNYFLNRIQLVIKK